MARKPILTTTAGIPVADNQNSVTAGARGPVLLQDYQLIEKLAHQNRERIPERVVHAKGWGAHGTFTVTNDITRYTYTQPGNLFRLMPPDAQIATFLSAFSPFQPAMARPIDWPNL